MSDDATDAEAASLSSPERFDEIEMGGRLVDAEHKCRYWWVASVAEGREVLDAGSGTGFGTAILADAGAASVTGVDISSDAVRVAAQRHARAEVKYLVEDLHTLPFDDDSFDLIACFEVLEHLDEREQVLGELRRVLRADGLLAISSPNRLVYPAGNPHHVYEYVPEELRSLLERSFAHVSLYRQHAWLATTLLDDAAMRAAGRQHSQRLELVKLTAVDADEETFTIALASAERLPEPDPLAVVGPDFEVRWWNDQLEGLRARSAAELSGLQSELALAQRAAFDAERARRAADTKDTDHRDGLLEAESEVATLRARVSELDALLDEGRGRAQALDGTVEDLRARLARSERTIADLVGSLSWTLTGPLRSILNLLRSLRRRF